MFFHMGLPSLELHEYHDHTRYGYFLINLLNYEIILDIYPIYILTNCIIETQSQLNIIKGEGVKKLQLLLYSSSMV